MSDAGGDPDASSPSDTSSTADQVDPCAASYDDSQFGLRIGSIFVILVTSLIGTFLPIILRQSSFVPKPVFEFAKYFGSGVIIATAFIHLLAPAFDELGSECLSGAWTEYDWAPAIAMAAVYGIFFAEIAAYRAGTAKLTKLGINYSSHAEDATDAHAHSHANEPPLGVDTSGPEHPLHGHPSHPHIARDQEKAQDDDDAASVSSAEAAAQLIAVGILEIGVIFHSIIIGLTLAVNEAFVTLFIVIIFHQMFEGLGLGSRLAALPLPNHLWWTRYAAGTLYAICTPVGIAAGLGVRTTYNGNGVAANIVSGVLDATSAGILLYTGLVELLAHEILFHPRMMKSSAGKLTYIFGCILLGSGLMALLGRWA